ncbi:TPA: hypothetical protein RQN76_003858, partial [Aeromonas dhakensis]|nr:hypothetical protein [Aeromonas dhakensis]
MSRDSLLNTVETMLGSHTKPFNIHNAISDAKEGATKADVLKMLAAALGGAQLLGDALKPFGVAPLGSAGPLALQASALYIGYQQIDSDLSANRPIKQSDVMGLVSSALGFAGSATAMMPIVPAVFPISLMVASAALLVLQVTAGESPFDYQPLVDQFNQTLTEAAEQFEAGYDEMAAAATEAFQAVYDAMEDTADALGQGADHLIDSAGDLLQLAGDAIAQHFSEMADKAGEALAQLAADRLALPPMFNGAFIVAAIAAALQQLFALAEQEASPLILDLDGDGVETLSLAKPIFFDHDGNGFAEQTGWVGADDGLLVFDRDGNGVIDRGSELFGNHTLVDGVFAANGFLALSAFDSNKDGRIDHADDNFAQLRIWRDTNSNGLTDSGELLTLAEAGVASINTRYKNQNVLDSQGNAHKQTGTFERTNGMTGEIHDVWFAVDQASTLDRHDVIISDKVAALPDVQAFGNVHRLHIAMMHDETLAAMVAAFATSQDPTARIGMVDEILFQWVGVAAIDSGARGSRIDARKLLVLEHFVAESFSQRLWGENPGQDASVLLEQAFEQLAEYVYSTLMAQTHLTRYVDMLSLTAAGSNIALACDLQALMNAFNETYRDSPTQAIYELRAFHRALPLLGTWGQTLSDELTSLGSLFSEGIYGWLGQWERSWVMGSDASQQLEGNSRDNVLAGMAGDDELRGGDGHDMLDGGAG